MRRILVVGYPKSGNTWATRLTAELLSAPTTSRSARARSRAACARLLQHLGVQRSAERVRTAIARQSLAAAKQRFEMRGDRRRASFLREGSSGAWVTALTAEQHALCARRFAPILERLGYADPRAPIPSPVAIGKARPMRLAVLALATSLTLATGIGAPLALAQDERDWVATDTDGHMVMRYVGARELTREQREEVTNMSLSTMVHDRLRVDRLFDGEPVDPAWSESWTATLTRFARESLPEIRAMTVECRSRSCRLAMAHEDGTRLDEHRALMDTFEPRIKAFLARHPGGFEPVFLMVAGYQAPEPAYVKVFLQRMQKR